MQGIGQYLTHATTLPHFLLVAFLLTVVFVGLMWALHQLSPRAKFILTAVCTFIAGLFFTLEFFLPTKLKDGEFVNDLTPYITPTSEYILVIYIWTLGLGIISLLLIHGRRLIARHPGWHNSLGFFIAFFAALVVGFVTKSGEWGGLESTAADGWLKAARLGYDSLYYGMLLNLDAAMFALLAFYISSAAYRAFRVRTIEAALLMIAALVVMLGVVNFGVWLTSWIPLDSPLAFIRFEQLSQYILNWLNMPAQRAVSIGVAVGSVAMAMRIWLSLERGAFFGGEK